MLTSSNSALLRSLLIQRTILAHHHLGVPDRRLVQVGETSAVLAGIAAAQWAGSRDLGGGTGAGGGSGLLQGSEESLDGLGGQVLVVVVVDLDHGGIDAGAQALDLNVGEEAVLSCVAGGDTEVLVDGLDDGITTAATELARGLWMI